MARKPAPSQRPARKPRLLWANPFCLLDTSSGANMSVRTMLRQLVAQGYEVAILGATVFDNPKGTTRIQSLIQELKPHTGSLVGIDDGDLTHHLFVTKTTYRKQMTTQEDGKWLNFYTSILDSFKPDLVWYYGGSPLEMLIPQEARTRGIPSAFYLVNGNYQAWRWCQDVNLILTDTQETASLYKKQVGFKPVPVGKFIETERFVAESHSRERLLFINPSLEKGATIVVQLALALEQQRPDITIEIVESRGNWPALLHKVTKELGQPRTELTNVVISPNTTDMRPIYGRARVLLTPSLWWESGARVLAEAMLNGIPAWVSNHGGNPGMIEDGGVLVDMPDACYEEPYDHLLDDEQVQALLDSLLPLLDDEDTYQSYVEKANRVGRAKHHIDVSTQRLLQKFAPLVSRRAGDKNFRQKIQQAHKHGLAPANHPGGSIPEKLIEARFNLDNLPTPKALGGRDSVEAAASDQNTNASGNSIPAPDKGDRAAEQGKAFDWQFKGQVVVLDNRSRLIQKGLLDALLSQGAVGVVSFDPASEVKNPEQYDQNENVQLVRHALLGDGKPGTLYTCLDPSLSSILPPLPVDQLPEHLRQGAQVITKLPINTITLDSIEGIEALDWLILDELSDAATILEHGSRSVSDALLIQSRVVFHPTHEQQPTFMALQQWADSNGFRFFRFNNPSHHTLFPENAGFGDRFASQLQSLDALFLPGEKRMEALDNNRKQKLVFLLHTVFSAYDAAHQIMRGFDEELAERYLNFVNEDSAPGNESNSETDGNIREYIFHIGMHRTGTTTLQEHFFPLHSGYFGRCKSKYGGWGYDVCSKKLLKATKSTNTRSTRDFIISTGNKSRIRKEEVAVFSNEAMIEPIRWGIAPFTIDGAIKGRARSPIFNFLESLQGLERDSRIKAIFVFRNQADWLASYYSRVSEYLLHPSQADFEMQVRNILRNNIDWITWSRWVEDLSNILGKENILVLPMEMMKENRYWERLGEFIGVREGAHSDSFSRVENRYSLSEGVYRISQRNGTNSIKRETTFSLSDDIRELVLGNEQIISSNKALEQKLNLDLRQYGYYLNEGDDLKEGTRKITEQE